MAVYVRTKRVTDPLREDVKACLCGADDRRPMTDCASGCNADHEALSSLVHAFFDCDDSDSPSVVDDAGYKPEAVKSNSDGGDRPEQEEAAVVGELVCGWTKGDPLRLRLLSDASKAAEALAAIRPCAPRYRRAVMVRLREMGSNAGICKARWESSGKLVAGSYEYIDVVLSEGTKEQRYMMDLSFASEFKVARAAKGYAEVVAALPEVMVARPEGVRQVVRMVGKAARQSLKAQGLHVPPWRKRRYMMAKWLGPYRRTVNAVPSPTTTQSAGRPGSRRPRGSSVK